MAENDRDFGAAAPTPGSWEERVKLPYIQLVNCKKGMGGLNGTGGFWSPDQLSPEMKEATFFNEAGRELIGFGGTKIEAAILCRRSRWTISDSRGDERAFSTYADAKEQLGEGMARKGKSHVQVAIWLKGADEPCMLTLRGMASESSKDFLNTINDIFARPATKERRRIKNDPKASAMPPYAFFVRIGVSEPYMVGKEKQKQIVCPILELPDRPDLQAAKAAYVGNALLSQIGEWIVQQGAVWRNQWLLEEGKSEQPPEWRGGEEPPPPEHE